VDTHVSRRGIRDGADVAQADQREFRGGGTSGSRIAEMGAFAADKNRG